MPTLSLPAITALARAGAVERAWEAFMAGGHAARGQSAAALAVKGRLLKDRARLSPTPRREALFGEAAEAYAQANAIDPSPYFAINAATANRLAARIGPAQEAARGVLALLDAPQPAADTPYYLAATRAEALLLLRDQAGAQQAMAAAARADPDGWHDRASTIAQLREIGAIQDDALDWLDAYAPPASLHFAGHIGIAERGASERELNRQLDGLLKSERLGFAWGALAAGADIVMAERLLDAGCELHAVLPCPPDRFERQSVAPAGEGWVARYRNLLDAAASVRLAGDLANAVHDPLATAHAGELAIGGAMLNARTLASKALQLVVLDEAGGGANTAAQARLWRHAIGRQIRLVVPRDQEVDLIFPPEQPDPARALALHAVVALDGPETAHRAESAAIGTALSALPSACVRAAPGRWELVSTAADQILGAVLAIQIHCRNAGAALPAIGAHLAIGDLVHDAASNSLIPYGAGPALAQRLQARAPAGSILVSDDLAVCLAARGFAKARTELFHFGEEETGGPVHLLMAQSDV